jgi:uncharacterized lipoprotein YddW (UPF0748 family)
MAQNSLNAPPATGGSLATAPRILSFGVRSALLGTLLLASGISCRSPAAGSLSASVNPPQPAREFRAAWVATVGNIDWPSRKGLSTVDQQAELLAILNRAVQLKLNAVVLQVRPACDAMYASRIEPWSEYLTGTMGQAPQPFYDPLAFAVAEAHKRGLELHAWFNPYRARVLGTGAPASANHISKTHPQLVRTYGKYLWLDPGEKQVQDYSLSVIMDVVKRYDVDGIHFDDYFYPYKEKDDAGKEMDFPDDASWRRFGAGGKLGRDDWRRENVNRFVERLYKSIKSAKPWVKFGISPFGIWRPGNPAQIKGLDSYSELYCDSRKWLANGWVDYLAPQLYWAIDPPDQSFPVLLKWWTAQNPRGRLLVAGMDTTHVRSTSQPAYTNSTRRGRSWPSEEIVNQIRLTRELPGVGGHIHWNMRALMRNRALDDALEREVYQQPALIPASPWLGGSAPGKPRLMLPRGVTGSQATLSWAASGWSKPWLWLVQARSGGRWTTRILPAAATSQTWDRATADLVAVSAVGRNGMVSSPAIISAKDRAAH